MIQGGRRAGRKGKEGERERQLGEKEGLAISPNQSGTAHGDRRGRPLRAMREVV